jgi:Xaa-Pro aminopeptidase
VPPDRRPARRKRLLDLLDNEALDGLIVSHLPNVRYLTGFTGTAGVALVLRQETVFLSDFRYREQAEAEVADHARVEIAPDALWKRMWQVISEYPAVETRGFEASTMSVAEAERMRSEGSGCEVRPTAGLVERLRERKDPEEVAAIREAGRLACEAFEATLSAVRVGQRELDIALRLERELRVRGSEWHPFPTIIASGPRSALPHARTSTRETQTGDWLLLDFGAQVDGYCADVTRTVVLGCKPDERQRTVYDLVHQAQLTARSGIRAEMTGREADSLARTPIAERGFGDAFGHSLGHGLGLEVHEAPRLSKSNESPLPAGAVVTVEPGIYIP